MFGQGTDGLLAGGLDLLDTPRQAAYKYGVDPAFHALGGDPDTHIGHFADLLGAAGMDPDSYLTKGLGMAGDMATDPLTYAGALGGRVLAGKLFGAAGPMHGSDAAKLTGLALPEGAEAAGKRAAVRSMAKDVMGSPNAAEILGEIPRGSTFQGAGAESLVLRTPEGDALRISPFRKDAAINYPQAAELNAPTRRQVLGTHEVSRTPLATDVGNEALYNQHKGALEAGLNAQGMDLFDFKPEDFGMVGGKPKVLDLGSVDAFGQSTGAVQNIAGPTPWRFAGRGYGYGAAAGGTAGHLSRTL